MKVKVISTFLLAAVVAATNERPLLAESEPAGKDFNVAMDSWIRHNNAVRVGDMLIPQTSGKAGKATQTRAGLVSYSHQKSIGVYLDPNLSALVARAFRMAMKEWNSIDGCNLRYVESLDPMSDPSSIDVWVARRALQNSKALASATLPVEGRPGPYIDVSHQADVKSEEEILFMAVHVLGHTLGFRHTNWKERGERSPIHVPGTPSADSNSVMNGEVARWRGFSKYDLAAARFLYPEEPDSTFDILGHGSWAQTTSMTFVRGRIYATEGRVLWRVHPVTGDYDPVGKGNWASATAMASNGDDLFVVDGSVLWVVDLDGNFDELGGNWRGTKAMAYTGGHLFAVEGSVLWKIDPTRKHHFREHGSGNWRGASAMVPFNGRLIISQGGSLWRVNPSNPDDFEKFGTGNWKGTSGMAVANGEIFAVQGKQLWRIDKYGNFKRSGSGFWGATHAMASDGKGFLFIADDSRLWKVSLK